MASLESSWDLCPAPSRALGGQAFWGTIGDLPYCVHAQLYPFLCSPIDHSLAGSSVRGIFQARILEQVVISTIRGSSQPRDQIYVSVSPVLAGGFFTSVTPGKPLWGKRLEWSLRDTASPALKDMHFEVHLSWWEEHAVSGSGVTGSESIRCTFLKGLGFPSISLQNAADGS